LRAFDVHDAANLIAPRFTDRVVLVRLTAYDIKIYLLAELDSLIVIDAKIGSMLPMETQFELVEAFTVPFFFQVFKSRRDGAIPVAS
jgi:hypothetical protein